ncbi:MAG: MFS transporter [Steroidobacteraceae bacterium]
MAVGLFNYVDRLCMSILVVPIRQELGLSDTQIGILTGLAFSLVYTLMAVPIARRADRGSRKRVIAASLGAWSLMTAGCGLASGFLVLAVLRMGVAIGEAGCIPAIQALLSDYYPRRERARVLAIWQLVFPLGSLTGIAASGWLSATLGWRATFALLGGIGLLLVPIVLATLREPPRGAADGRAAPGPPRAIPLAAALRALWSLPSYRGAVLGGALLAWPLNVALVWNGPFYSRVFHVPVAELGLQLALLSGGAGAVGLFGGGSLAAWLSRRDLRWQLWVPGIAGLLVAPFMIAQYYAGDARSSLLLGVVPVVLLNAFLPPQAAAAQSLAAPDLRALAAATIVLISGSVGTALGPFTAGVLSDLLARRFGLGDDALRHAIASTSVLALLGGVLFLRAARHFPQDLQRPAQL